ncbi:MAG TPA: type II secretion system protein [Gaiellaceae bacterium]|jgi:prepilin-type N-terminal cleavage/methylation domain-containing protein
MKAIASRLRLHSESGFTLVELIISMAVMGIILGGLADVFVSGERANADATARMTSQQSVRAAFDRLEYDARCASTGTLLNKTGSNGAGVYLVLPSQCDHASGTVTWCVSSGSLIRNSGTTCAATTHRLTYITSVTSATPFSCYSPVSGSTPQLRVALTVNPSTRNSDKTTSTDLITMHNAASTGCT